MTFDRKEYTKKYNKDYYNNNKDIINKKVKHCEVCDKDILNIYYSKHKKTKTHIQNINKYNSNKNLILELNKKLDLIINKENNINYEQSIFE